MENAVDALKLGAFVMIFVIALSVSITAFSEARIASSTLLDYRDREASLGQDDYWYSTETGQQRKVGLETVIPTVYRSYSDSSIKVAFLKKNGDKMPLYTTNTNEGNEQQHNVVGRIYTNNKHINIGDEKQFIERIIYGEKEENKSTNGLIRLKIISSFDDYISKYNAFIEYSGMYINGEEDGKSSMPTANKETIRVITYQVEK